MVFRLFILALCFCLPLSAKIKFHQWELSVAAIFQDDARFLKEWIEFHRLVGVEHFWLYNNGSNDNFQKVLAPYIKEGVVELINWPQVSHQIVLWNQIQCAAYLDAAKRAAGKSLWLAVIDTDEFLFSPCNRSVKEVLRNYKGVGGVGVNWMMFGTSDIPRIPEDRLMIELLTHRAPKNEGVHYHVKSIINPLLAKSIDNPHFFYFLNNFVSVTTSSTPFLGPFSPTIEHDLLRINHYWTRDEEYLYQRKVKRYKDWGESAEKVLKAAHLYNQEVDGDILHFVPALKARMGL